MTWWGTTTRGGEMERFQNGTQLMGTPWKCSCSRHCSRVLLETPGSGKTHLVSRNFLPPIPTYHHAKMSQFWRGGWMLEDTTAPLIFPAIPDNPDTPATAPHMSPHTDKGQTTALRQELYHNQTNVSISFFILFTYSCTTLQLSNHFIYLLFPLTLFWYLYTDSP